MQTVAYGDGTLSQRKTGLHAGRWEYHRTVDGRRRTATWDRKPTRQMIAAKIAEWSNISPPQTGGSVADYLELWLRDGTIHLRPRTIIGYRRLVELDINPWLGQLRLVSLNTPTVQQWVNNGATRHALMCLRAAMTQAVKWGILDRNPASLARPLPRQRKETTILSIADARKLIAQVKGDPLEALWLVALFTGMRQGEILGLRWQDIDLRAKTLTVSASLWWKPGADGRIPVLTEPKTKQSRRTLALTDTVIDALTEHRKRQLLTSKDGLVFTRADGTAMEPSSVYAALHRHLKAAGIPIIRFHDLRHTAASMLLYAKVPIPLVSQYLGHSNIATTMSIYAHAMEEAKTELPDQMFRLLNSEVVSETG